MLTNNLGSKIFLVFRKSWQHPPNREHVQMIFIQCLRQDTQGFLIQVQCMLLVIDPSHHSMAVSKVPISRLQRTIEDTLKFLLPLLTEITSLLNDGDTQMAHPTADRSGDDDGTSFSRPHLSHLIEEMLVRVDE